MKAPEIAELQRIFTTRLDMLDQLLAAGEKQLPGTDLLQERLAPDMFPLGTQIAYACNQPRSFAQWCAGQPVENLDPAVSSMAIARSHIQGTKALLAAIDVDDAKLDEIKHTGLGPSLHLETPARLYLSDFAIPNFYFHITIAYAILRKLGVPVGKADYMAFLLPHVRQGP